MNTHKDIFLSPERYNAIQVYVLLQDAQCVAQTGEQTMMRDADTRNNDVTSSGHVTS